MRDTKRKTVGGVERGMKEKRIMKVGMRMGEDEEFNDEGGGMGRNFEGQEEH